MHAIGDGAIEQAIRVLAQVRGGFKKGAIMHRIVHCQITNASQIQRMVALGLMAEIQPVFLQTDMHWAASRVGKSRLQTSYCWHTMDEAGLFMTGGSDAPVEDINPWPGVYTSVTRMDNSGHYASDWEGDESLSLERALEIYTSASAQLAGWKHLGQLQPGMKADIAVYKQFDQENLANNKPDQLIIAGRTIYLR
jgi:predicted amidohydrolase YtcJ